MNRKDFQTLSDLRVKEGKALLDKEFWSGAYYLLGYAVECALKACICRHIRRYDFPDRRTVQDSYKHNLESLLTTAGDKTKKFASEMARNKNLERNWSMVVNWKETVRYEHNISDKKAKDFYLAIIDKKNGVLTWLKKCW